MTAKNRYVVYALLLTMGLFLSGSPVVAQRKTVKSDSKILYYNGPVMASTVNLYVIWYGCWECGFPGSDPETQTLLLDFLTSVGGSPYAAINTTYPRADGWTPSGGMVYGGSIVDLYSHRSTLTDADVGSIVARAITSGDLPGDSRGIFLVLLSSDISLPGISDGRCQLHGAVTPPQNTTFIYGAVVNPMRAPSLCAPQFSAEPSPNGNVAGDAMASWIAHVINGAITNPTGGGWYDRYGLENSDKCQGTYGDTYPTANGGRANMQLGMRDYLIQQNWINDGRGRCGLSWYF